jgi:hypothetical protein
LEAEDAGIFFGREAATIGTLDRLRGLSDAAPPRFLVILGASGAGKSSYLRAGVLPKLARDDRHFLPLPVVRPERAAINGESGLLRALEKAFADHGVTTARADIRAGIAGGAATLRSFLAKLVDKALAPLLVDDPKAKPPVLVLAIDQGEELFHSEGAQEGQALLTLLVELLAQDAPAMVAIVAIRSDSYERLQTAKPLESIEQRTISLPPMPRTSYQAVIEGPAARLQRTSRPLAVDPALTQALLADIEGGGGRDALPLLAFTLERLYLEFGARGRLTLADYEQLGGVKGSIEAAVERALKAADGDPRIPADHAARLTLLRRGLIPWLAGIDPESGSPRRRVARKSEIPEEARPLIDLLVEQRLLSTDVAQDTGEVTIEPAHEALLRQWGLLQGWLEEDFAALSTLESVKRAARDWAANDCKEDWLNHAGARLEEAENLQRRPDLAEHLDEAERNYLAWCRYRANEELREKEEALEREKLRQAEVAEAQDATAKSQRRAVAIITAISAVAAVLIGLFAFLNHQKATEVADGLVRNAKLDVRNATQAKKLIEGERQLVTGKARLFAELAAQSRKDNHWESALRFAVYGVRIDPATPQNGPSTARVELAKWLQEGWLTRLRGHTEAINKIAF